MRKIVSASFVDLMPLYTIPRVIANEAGLFPVNFGMMNFTQWFGNTLDGMPMLDGSCEVGVPGKYLVKSYQDGLRELRATVGDLRERMFVYVPSSKASGHWFRVGIVNQLAEGGRFFRVGTIRERSLNRVGVNVHTHPVEHYLQFKEEKIAAGMSEKGAELFACFANMIPSFSDVLYFENSSARDSVIVSKAGETIIKFGEGFPGGLVSKYRNIIKDIFLMTECVDMAQSLGRERGLEFLCLAFQRAVKTIGVDVNFNLNHTQK